MPPVARTKNVVYKRAQVLGVASPADPLSVLLERALQICVRASDRHLALGEDSHTRVLNTPRRHHGMTAASLIEFVPGELPMTVRLVDGADEYELTQVQRSNAAEEFLRSQLFFGALQNHVALAQSASLKSGHLEEYLTWLLTERTRVLQNGAKVVLLDHTHVPETVTERQLAGVRAVRLFTSVTPTGMAEAERGVAPTLRTRESPEPSTLLRRMVASLLPDDVRASLEGIAANEGLAVDDLEVSFEIRRRGRIDPEGRSLLDEVAMVTRNSEDIHFELEVPGVGKFTREQLQLRKPVQVRTTNGAVHFEELVPKMFDWLRDLIAAGEIPPS